MGTSLAVKRIAEASPRSLARLAGFLYVLIIRRSLVYTDGGPQALRHDARGRSVAYGRPNPGLKIIDMCSVASPNWSIGGCDICVALIFYELLKPVSRGLALLAAFFRLVFVAIANVNVLNQFAPLVLLSRTEYLRAFKPDQLQALALVFIRLRTIGFDIALVFFGFHCVVLGYLHFRVEPSFRASWACCWRLGEWVIQ